MKKGLIFITVLCSLWMLRPFSVFAARPLITEDTGTAEKGSFELELAFDYLRDCNDDKFYIPSAQLAYGLTERAEIAANIGYILKDVHEGERVDGWSDLIAYLKYRLWGEGKYYPALAIKPLVKFPTADWKKDIGSGKTDYGLSLVFGKSFARLHLHFEALYFYVGERDKTDVLITGLCGDYEIMKGLLAVGEVRYFRNFNSISTDDPALMLLGLQAGSGKVVFDAGFIIGLNSAAPDYGFTIGLTLKFK
ncbi:MAG: hypothetical protein HY882_11140 [Deltaproteobacteria bacterium]|nr:hypothetical protein [Deltaproteobacteria bacterium]